MAYGRRGASPRPSGADYPLVWPRIGEKLGHIALGSGGRWRGARAGRQEACIITGATQPPLRSAGSAPLIGGRLDGVRFGRTFNFGGNAEKEERGLLDGGGDDGNGIWCLRGRWRPWRRRRRQEQIVCFYSANWRFCHERGSRRKDRAGGGVAVGYYWQQERSSGRWTRSANCPVVVGGGQILTEAAERTVRVSIVRRRSRRHHADRHLILLSPSRSVTLTPTRAAVTPRVSCNLRSPSVISS